MRESESAISLIKDANLFLEEIKNKQLVGGNNVLFYSYHTDALYDLAVLSAATERNFLVEFDQAAGTMGIINLRAYYRIEDPNVMEDPVENGILFSDISVYLSVLTPEVGVTKFNLRVVNNTYLGGSPTPLTAYIKLFFSGTDTGTFIITEV